MFVSQSNQRRHPVNVLLMMAGTGPLLLASTPTRGLGTVSFGSPQSAQSQITTPIGVGIGDLNLDGGVDAAGLYAGVVVFHNEQGVLVPDDSAPLPYFAPFEPTVRIADASGDGLPDIIVSATGAQNLTLFLQERSGGFIEADTGIVTATYVPRFALGRFNDDDLPDVVMSNLFAVYLNLGSGQFIAVGEPAFVPFQSQVFAANLDGDALDDVLTIAGSPASARVFRNLGGGVLELAGEYDLPPSVSSAELAVMVDLNHDGLSDLAAVTHEAMNNFVMIRLGQPDATLAEAATFTVPGIPIAIAAGDLNGDGHVDLAVGLGSTTSVALLLGDGDGDFEFAGQTAPAVSASGPLTIIDLAIADITGDALRDIVVVVVGYGLVVIPNTTSNAANLDGDDDVDVNDYAIWSACLGGPGAAIPIGCTSSDLEADGDVDLKDAGLFQNLFAP